MRGTKIFHWCTNFHVSSLRSWFFRAKGMLSQEALVDCKWFLYTKCTRNHNKHPPPTCLFLNFLGKSCTLLTAENSPSYTDIRVFKWCHQSCQWVSLKQKIWCESPVADLRGGGRDASLPLGQNFFIFMHFSRKIGQIVCWRPLWGWRTRSGKSWIRHWSLLSYLWL